MESWWEQCGGPAVKPWLDAIDLIDAQYLIALAHAGGVVPKWQDVPDEARINGTNLLRIQSFGGRNCLPVLVLSYCWYSQTHPDPLGEQLRRIVPILEIMVKDAKLRGGRSCTIAVFQDYTALPQGPDRTDMEKKRFDVGIKMINHLYMHPFTIVLMITQGPSFHQQHTNRRLYHERGWCFFEMRASSIVKDNSCLWDFGKVSAGQYLG